MATATDPLVAEIATLPLSARLALMRALEAHDRGLIDRACSWIDHARQLCRHPSPVLEEVAAHLQALQQRRAGATFH